MTTALRCRILLLLAVCAHLCAGCYRVGATPRHIWLKGKIVDSETGEAIPNSSLTYSVQRNAVGWPKGGVIECPAGFMAVN